MKLLSSWLFKYFHLIGSWEDGRASDGFKLSGRLCLEVKFNGTDGDVFGKSAKECLTVSHLVHGMRNKTNKNGTRSMNIRKPLFCLDCMLIEFIVKTRTHMLSIATGLKIRTSFSTWKFNRKSFLNRKEDHCQPE